MTVYHSNVRLSITAFCIVADIQTFDRGIGAGGHSAQRAAEKTVGAVKEATSLSSPIGPSTTVSFSDLAADDITNIDYHDVSQDEKQWAEQQS